MRHIEELQSPEIQTMYSLNMPVSAIRTKIRQEFEKHRYVSQLSVIDVLLFQSHAEFQVSGSTLWNGSFSCNEDGEKRHGALACSLDSHYASLAVGGNHCH